MKKRCINIDWLEVYCLEDFNKYPMNADFYRKNGIMVREREYGTRQYNEMFTVLDKDDESYMEIRRNPVSSMADSRNNGIFDPLSCHIRLSNRHCYDNEAIYNFSELLNKLGYTIVRIFRIDLALDFEYFDSKDEPYKFLQRYMAGKYSKINQGNINAHGADTWESRNWYSVSWGARTSMVSTKFYCKTKELAEVRDKPYIRWAWFDAGLVDDFTSMSKKDADGNWYQPLIWRVEFSIKSSARAWYLVEDEHSKKKKTIRMPHDLGCYNTKKDQLKAFAMLAHHYFYFKHYTPNVRKDRCKDKPLFYFNLSHEPYTLTGLLTERPERRSIERLKMLLEEYRLTHHEERIIKAVDTLLESLRDEKLLDALPFGATYDRFQLLRLLISKRIKENPQRPLEEDIAMIEHMLEIEKDLL